MEIVEAVEDNVEQMVEKVEETVGKEAVGEEISLQERDDIVTEEIAEVDAALDKGATAE